MSGHKGSIACGLHTITAQIDHGRIGPNRVKESNPRGICLQLGEGLILGSWALYLASQMIKFKTIMAHLLELDFI